MGETVLFDMLRQALLISVRISAPLLGVALIAGVVIGLFQALTSVQEMTLTFVPKLVGAGLIILLAGSWMMREMVSWVTGLWAGIPGLG